MEANPTILSDRYELLEKLGEGAYGVVYRARHIAIDKPVAIKMLKLEGGEFDNVLERFQFEAKAASKLGSHPNIVSVHDYGVDEKNVPYIVMDLVEGISLSDWLDKNARLPLEDAIDVFIDACSGLQHAHAKGLIHRDLKAGNIILSEGAEGRRWTAKILDFGMAKVTGYESQSQRLTPSGLVIGTFLYLSPEQCLGRQPDERSDIYSLGCAFYEALTGLPPFVGENVLDTVQLHINQPHATLSEARADLSLPKELEEIVARVLAKSPADRYQSASELKAALVALKEAGNATTGGAVSSVMNSKAASNWASPIAIASAAFVVVAAVVVVGVINFAPANKGKTFERNVEVSYQALRTGNSQAAADALTAATRETAKSRDSEADRLANLAVVCHKKGQCDTATSILEQSVQISKKVYGARSKQTADRLTELASFYVALGEFRKAEKVIDEVMEIRSQTSQ